MTDPLGEALARLRGLEHTADLSLAVAAARNWHTLTATTVSWWWVGACGHTHVTEGPNVQPVCDALTDTPDE